MEVPEWYVTGRAPSPDVIRSTASIKAQHDATEIEEQEAINAFDITHGQFCRSLNCQSTLNAIWPGAVDILDGLGSYANDCACELQTGMSLQPQQHVGGLLHR